MRSIGSISILLGLVAASCASSSGEIPAATGASTTVAAVGPESDPPATAPPGPITAPAVTFDSEPIEAGPLFGSSARSAADADTANEGCTVDLEECDSSDERPDDVDLAQRFVPAEADAPFCAKLDELSERPFPSDELEGLVVAQAWFAELRPAVLGEILADFDVLSDWLDTAVRAQGQMSLDDTNDAVERASNSLDDYVDRRCEGLDR